MDQNDNTKAQAERRPTVVTVPFTYVWTSEPKTIEWRLADLGTSTPKGRGATPDREHEGPR